MEGSRHYSSWSFPSAHLPLGRVYVESCACEHQREVCPSLSRVTSVPFVSLFTPLLTLKVTRRDICG